MEIRIKPQRSLEAGKPGTGQAWQCERRSESPSSVFDQTRKRIRLILKSKVSQGCYPEHNSSGTIRGSGLAGVARALLIRPTIKSK